MSTNEQAGAPQSSDRQLEDNGTPTDTTPTAQPSAHPHTQLHEVWMRWSQATLALLRRRPVVVAPDYDIVLTAVGNTATLGPHRPDLRQTVDAYAGDLTSQGEFHALAQLIVDTPELHAGLQPIGTPAFTDPQSQLSALWHVCRTFLLEYLTLTSDNALRFEETRFERVYAQLEDYIFQPGPFPSEWLLHVSNLSLEPTRVDLEHGLALRQMPPEERTWLIKQQLYTRTGGRLFDNVLAVAAYEDTQAKWSSQLGVTAPVLTAGNTVTLALRLLKPQPIGLTGYHWQPVNQPFLTFPRLYTPFTFNVPPLAYFGDKYMLTSDDADKLVGLWPKVKGAPNDNQLKMALTRLEDSYHRTKDEDRLIDYWIALESLFLPRRNTPALQGQMVAAVVAHYLGATVSDRNSIASILVESHELRNDIIHADEIKRTSKVAELVTKTGVYLREALRRRIQE
jgi:Apea-like HEPN